jgi:hypothetical protein
MNVERNDMSPGTVIADKAPCDREEKQLSSEDLKYALSEHTC